MLTSSEDHNVSVCNGLTNRANTLINHMPNGKYNLIAVAKNIAGLTTKNTGKFTVQGNPITISKPKKNSEFSNETAPTATVTISSGPTLCKHLINFCSPQTFSCSSGLSNVNLRDAFGENCFIPGDNNMYQVTAREGATTYTAAVKFKWIGSTSVIEELRKISGARPKDVRGVAPTDVPVAIGSRGEYIRISSEVLAAKLAIKRGIRNGVVSQSDYETMMEALPTSVLKEMSALNKNLAAGFSYGAMPTDRVTGNVDTWLSNVGTPTVETDPVTLKTEVTFSYQEGGGKNNVLEIVRFNFKTFK